LNVYGCIGPNPVAARTEAWVCGRSLAGIVGSNLAGEMDVCLFRVLCQVEVSADHSSRGVLANVVRLSVIVNPRL